jgi:uncharacterized membrane protein
VLLVAILVAVFWTQVNAALRGIYPAWPFVAVLPLVFDAYARAIPACSDPGVSFAAMRMRLVSLLRASVAVPIGRHTFRLYVFCHGLPDRSFAIRGHTFPLCARCTGLLIGTAAGSLMLAGPYLGSVAAAGLAFVLAVPLLVDGLTQAAGLRMSTNPLRLSTGVLGGVGFALVAQVLGGYLAGF